MPHRCLGCLHGASWKLVQAKDWVYKPMVKSSGGRRESEGVVVPVIGVQHNAPGGKGPHFDHAGGEGKREGMAGTARSNYPGWPEPAVLGWESTWKCDDFNASYGLRPSSLRSGGSTPCMTVFAGVTSCGRRGNGSGKTAGLPGWIGSPWRMCRRSAGSPGCWGSSRLICAQAPTIPRPPGRGHPETARRHAGQSRTRTEEWFNGHGLYRLRGTVRYSKAT